MSRKAAIIIGVVIVIIAGLYMVISRETQIVKPKLPGDNIICFGDSLTHGYGASPGMDYPRQLSGLIGMPVINAGVDGDTTADAWARLQKDVLEKSPKIVIVILGGNDLLKGVKKEDAFSNLKKIVEGIKAKGALVVIGGIDIPLLGRGYGDAYKVLSREAGAVLIPNVYSGLLGREYLMSDPIHPNDKGYQIIAERVYAAIKDYL